MNKIMRCRASAPFTGLALCALSAQALALPPPPYAVVELGQSFIGLKSAGAEEDGFQQQGSDRRDVGYGITLGWPFSDHLAAEATFLELGQANYDVEFQDGSAVSDATVRVGSTGVLLALAGTWPLREGWSLEGRAGGYLGKTETRLRGVSSGPFGNQDFDSLVGSSSKVGLAAGVGIVASLSETWALRAGYDYLDKAFGENAGRFSVGVRFNWP